MVVNVKNYDLKELRERFAALGLPAFRGQQVFQQLWRRGADSFAAMSDLPRALRERLEVEAALPSVELADCQVARDGTRKLLVGLPDGERVESVLIPDRERRTLCVSTQVGCAMGCTFCRTATMGLKRHLEPWEIVDQIRLAESILDEAGDRRQISGGPSQRSRVSRRLTNLVFMGMGEPLHNLDGTLSALRILTAPEGFDFPPRRITVSTVGLPDEAARFLDETRARLAFSLNAPDDVARSAIMPVNRRFPIARLIDLAAGLPPAQKDRVTFEYVLLKGQNDRPGDSEKLARLLAPLGRGVKVNLIPFNPFDESGFERPDPERVEALHRALRHRGVDAFIRRPRGDDILAACGQLAHKNRPSPELEV